MGIPQMGRRWFCHVCWDGFDTWLLFKEHRDKAHPAPRAPGWP